MTFFYFILKLLLFLISFCLVLFSQYKVVWHYYTHGKRYRSMDSSTFRIPVAADCLVFFTSFFLALVIAGWAWRVGGVVREYSPSPSKMICVKIGRGCGKSTAVRSKLRGSSPTTVTQPSVDLSGSSFEGISSSVASLQCSVDANASAKNSHSSSPLVDFSPNSPSIPQPENAPLSTPTPAKPTPAIPHQPYVETQEMDIDSSATESAYDADISKATYTRSRRHQRPSSSSLASSPPSFTPTNTPSEHAIATDPILSPHRDIITLLNSWAQSRLIPAHWAQYVFANPDRPVDDLEQETRMLDDACRYRYRIEMEMRGCEIYGLPERFQYDMLKCWVFWELHLLEWEGESRRGNVPVGGGES